MKISTIVLTGAIATGLVFGVHAASSTKARSQGTSAAIKPAHIGAPMTSAERHQLIRTVVLRWSSYVKQVRGTDPVVWARSMGGTFAVADPANFRRAAAASTYEGMIAALLGQKLSDDAVIDALATANSQSVIQALGSPSSDLVYTVITPCRILDTREAGGKVAGNSVRDFDAARPGGNFSDQGGSATDCGIPADPAAVVINLVSVQPDAPGFVTLYPYGEAMPLSSSINNVVGSDVGNETVVKLSVGTAYDFSAYAYAGVDLVADAVGYFAAPETSALDCTTVSGTTTNLIAGEIFSVSATCGAGYTLTGGGDRASGGNPNVQIAESFPQGNSWIVVGRNVSTGNENVHARAICCRVPGR